jgi:hypothetical protein
VTHNGGSSLKKIEGPVDTVFAESHSDAHTGRMIQRSGLVIGKSLDPASTFLCLFRGIHCLCCVQLSGNQITGALSCRGPRTVAGAPRTRFAIHATGSGFGSRGTAPMASHATGSHVSWRSATPRVSDVTSTNVTSG